jgi:hypothetical protein
MISVQGPDEEPPQDAVSIEDDPGLDIAVLQRRREKVLVVGAVAILIGTVLGILYLLRPAPVSRKEVIAVAQDAVRRTICEGRTCQFSEPLETSVEIQPDGNYVVAADLIVLTPAGASRSYRFTCVLYRLQDGSGWMSAKTELVPY